MEIDELLINYSKGNLVINKFIKLLEIDNIHQLNTYLYVLSLSKEPIKLTNILEHKNQIDKINIMVNKLHKNKIFENLIDKLIIYKKNIEINEKKFEEQNNEKNKRYAKRF